MTSVYQRRLVRDAAALYRPAGRFAEHFARGKLAGDPVFAALLRQGWIPDGARLVDLGCGQGLLAAWLLTARRCFESADGGWPADWPTPPRLGYYLGVEWLPAEAERARLALGAAVDILTGDVRTLVWREADVVVLLDVLYFLDPPTQEQLLARIRAALSPTGVLLLRVADATSGPGFWWTQAVDHAVAWWRGHGLSRFHCRSRRDWEALLIRLGFVYEAQPMSTGTPFANVLFVARPRRYRLD